MGIDSSIELAKMAATYSGTKVIVGRIENATLGNKFDGIWACASLLHNERSLLPRSLENMHKALKPGGFLFLSVREGEGTRYGEDGRFYTFYSSDELNQALIGAGFKVESTWKTQDVIPNRVELSWLNILAKNLIV